MSATLSYAVVKPIRNKERKITHRHLCFILNLPVRCFLSLVGIDVNDICCISQGVNPGKRENIKVGIIIKVVRRYFYWVPAGFYACVDRYRDRLRQVVGIKDLLLFLHIPEPLLHQFLVQIQRRFGILGEKRLVRMLGRIGLKLVPQLFQLFRPD